MNRVLIFILSTLREKWEHSCGNLGGYNWEMLGLVFSFHLCQGRSLPLFSPCHRSHMKVLWTEAQHIMV